MAVKPNAKTLVIKEQIIEDPASGLTLMFEAYPEPHFDSIRLRLRICGDSLPFGNRDLCFTKDGELGAAGTATGAICKPSWLRAVGAED